MAADEPGTPPGMEMILAGEDDADLWEEIAPGDEHTLVDLINRVLDKGVVISGDITISVAGVELVYLSLNALLTSVSTARRALDAKVGRGEGASPGEGG